MGDWKRIGQVERQAGSDHKIMVRK